MSSTAAPHASEPNASDLHGWKLLAPLPDPIGFAGMFAGVLKGQLIAGGGSHFRDKPLWLNGEKVFSDRIFTLSQPGEAWKEHPTRLPLKAGSFASAATHEAIYLAGGITAEGCTTQVWEIRASEKDFAFKRLPDLPHPIGYAAGAIVKGRFYIVGGVETPTAKIATAETWSLEIAASGKGTWRREPDIPSPGVLVPAAASDGTNLLAFGGIGFNKEEKPVPSKAAHRLSIATGKWERLADMPEPRVAPSSPCPVLPGNKVFVIGGYAEVFPGKPRDYPGFTAQTLLYDLAHNRWECGPVLPVTKVLDRDTTSDPGPSPMAGAPCVLWKDLVVVVSGEVRSSVRTPTVLAWDLHIMPARHATNSPVVP